MLSVVFVLEVPKSFMTDDDDDDVVAKNVNGKGDSFQQRHAHKKHEQQQRSKERLCCCCSILSKSSIIGCLFAASKERERERFENARTNNVTTKLLKGDRKNRNSQSII